jgi:hypothetical protein
LDSVTRGAWLARLAVLAVLALASTRAHAAEVVPFLENGALGASVRGLQFPQSLAKDLTSGLTNHMVVRVTLQAPGQTITERLVSITVKYDLWEETFLWTLSVDGQGPMNETHTALNTVLVKLRESRLPALFAEAALPPGSTFTLRADVLLNPIDAERIRKIRKWVAENSTYTAGQGGVPDSNTSSAANELFNRIFEQFAAGANAAAVWRESAVSAPFRLETLPRAPP